MAWGTLLKKGNRDVLAIFGHHDVTSIDIDDFTLGATSILLGDGITFSFSIQAKEPAKVRLEYGIDYVKANGKKIERYFKSQKFH